jgi:1,4-dihydroxy-2-naphthoyl-CoA hydrolase
MSIWSKPVDPAALTARQQDTLAALLDIRITEIGPDYVRAEMPVDSRHVQPFGLLHGGASVVLSETLGSMACYLTLPPGKGVVGLEINANHISGVKAGGRVTAECRPLHLGRTTQVWQTEIRREDGKLVCVSRLTCAVLDRD